MGGNILRGSDASLVLAGSFSHPSSRRAVYPNDANVSPAVRSRSIEWLGSALPCRSQREAAISLIASAALGPFPAFLAAIG